MAESMKPLLIWKRFLKERRVAARQIEEEKEFQSLEAATENT